jgi:hypothetical protein
MSSPALALTPVPSGSGAGAGATTGTAQPTATVITHRVRTRLENRRPGNRGASQALHGPGAPCFPLSFRQALRLQRPARGAHD